MAKNDDSEWVIQPGDSIPLAIEHGLESSRTLVLVMSQAACDSDWVTLERYTALFRDHQPAKTIHPTTTRYTRFDLKDMLMATNDSSKRDIVLFLGAGFSHAAGLPIMSRFGDASREQFAALVRRHVIKDSPLFTVHRNSAERVATAAGFFEAFRQFVIRASNLVDINPGNLEDIFCMAEMLNEAGVEVIIDGKKRPASQILQKTKEWLWDIYKKYRPNDADFHSNEAPYVNFIEHLKSRNLLERLAVLTTNYDVVFEIVSYKCGICCSYPLDRVADSICLQEGLQRYVELAERPDSPVVCKLHGSVNFLATDTPDSKILVADRWANKGNWRQPEVLFLEPSHELLRKNGLDLTPELVPPTYAKLQQSAWLKQSWAYSLRTLSSANAIIFIGYSFPPSDGFMRAMIRSAMGMRDRKAQPPNVWVFDPSPSVIQEYQQFFRELGEPAFLHCHQLPFSRNDNIVEELVAALDSMKL